MAFVTKRGVEMRLLKRLVFFTAGLAMFLTLPVQQTEVHGQQRGGGGRGQAAGGGRGPARMEVWAPMPEKANPFIPPNKPITRIKDLLAKHKGDQNWTEVIVNDKLFHGESIS